MCRDVWSGVGSRRGQVGDRVVDVGADVGVGACRYACIYVDVGACRYACIYVDVGVRGCQQFFKCIGGCTAKASS